MSEQLRSYPHTAVIQIGVAIYKKNQDGSLGPSAIGGGTAKSTISGDSLDECKAEVEKFLLKKGVIAREESENLLSLSIL